MTPELIERFASDAGWRVDTYTAGSKRTLTMVTPTDLEQVLRFAALVAAHEREECAKVCEDGIDQAKEDGLLIKSRKLVGQDGELQALKFWSTVSLYNNARKLCAAAIRGRTG